MVSHQFEGALILSQLQCSGGFWKKYGYNTTSMVTHLEFLNSQVHVLDINDTTETYFDKIWMLDT